MKSTHTKLINDDCRTALKPLRANSIDLVVTDPPFVVRYKSRKNGREYPNDNNTQWMRPAFSEIFRVLKPDSFCICFYGWKKASHFLNAWEAAGFKPVGHLVWIKDYTSNRGTVEYRHDVAYVLAKGRPTPQHMLKDVLPYEFPENRIHPAQRPVTAIEPLIAAFSKSGEIVLDPFMGSGTTGEAARSLGRRFIGIELDPTYYQLAAKRLRQTA